MEKEVFKGLTKEEISILEQYAARRESAKEELTLDITNMRTIEKEISEDRIEEANRNSEKDGKVVDELLKGEKEEIARKLKGMRVEEGEEEELLAQIEQEEKEKKEEEEERKIEEEEKEEEDRESEQKKKRKGKKGKKGKNREAEKQVRTSHFKFERNICSYSYFLQSIKPLRNKFKKPTQATDVCDSCERGYKLVSLFTKIQGQLNLNPENEVLEEQLRAVKNQVLIVLWHKQDNKKSKQFIKEICSKLEEGTGVMLFDWAKNREGSTMRQEGQDYYCTPHFSLMVIVCLARKNGKIVEVRRIVLLVFILKKKLTFVQDYVWRIQRKFVQERFRIHFSSQKFLSNQGIPRFGIEKTLLDL